MSKVLMCPPAIPESASRAEKKIFEALKTLDFDCTVFHSVGMAKHKNKVYGELDFIVISQKGVLCLEVKGGAIACENNEWLYTNQLGETNVKSESPFQQAVGNMLSLRDHVRKALPNPSPLYHTQFACAVAFPDTVFKQKLIDFPSQLIRDERGGDLSQFLRDAYGYWSDKSLEKVGIRGTSLSHVEIDTIAALIRPNFSGSLKLTTIIDDTEKSIFAFTDEQVEIFTAQLENPRMLVTGGAGTGKTILASELAKKAAAEKKRVLFLTYNKNIASKISVDLRSDPNSDFIHVAYFHNLLESISGSLPDDDQGTTVYYETTLPERFLAAVRADSDLLKPYDVLVVDEGQDLLRLTYCECFDALLQGGLENGKWYIFLDEHQNLYNLQDLKDGKEFLETLRPAYHHLITNCRNTPQIADYSHKMTRIKKARTMKMDGPSVKTIVYKDASDLRNKIREQLKQFHSQGIPYGDITILTSHRYENSPLSELDAFESVCALQKINENNVAHLLLDAVHHCTVHRFKGLDSKVVFYIDPPSGKESKDRFINYTAISRARSVLVVFREG